MAGDSSGPCWAHPAAPTSAGVVITPAAAPPAPHRTPWPVELVCDRCGSTDVAEVRCKVVCRACRTILMTCSDL